MADVLAEIGGVQLTIRATGAAAALLVLFLFILLRTAMNKTAPVTAKKLIRWVDGIGFGILPAAAVWKVFENLYLGTGREVIEPLPLINGLTENGRFLPCRIETATALLCFTAVCIWLMFRKNDIEEKGDMLLISVSVWSGIRIITESFREVPDNTLRYVYCGMILISLAVWTAGQIRMTHEKSRAAANWIAVILCMAMIILTTSGTLSVGSAIGDLAVIAGCTALMVLVLLLCRSDQRNSGFSNQNSE